MKLWNGAKWKVGSRLSCQLVLSKTLSFWCACTGDMTPNTRLAATREFSAQLHTPGAHAALSPGRVFLIEFLQAAYWNWLKPGNMYYRMFWLLPIYRHSNKTCYDDNKPAMMTTNLLWWQQTCYIWWGSIRHFITGAILQDYNTIQLKDIWNNR